jgi:hypothetical protein
VLWPLGLLGTRARPRVPVHFGLTALSFADGRASPSLIAAGAACPTGKPAAFTLGAAGGLPRFPDRRFGSEQLVGLCAGHRRQRSIGLCYLLVFGLSGSRAMPSFRNSTDDLGGL